MTKSELRRIIHSLGAFYDRDEAETWMTSPHPELKDRRPMDCSFEEVDAVIERLHAGAYL